MSSSHTHALVHLVFKREDNEVNLRDLQSGSSTVPRNTRLREVFDGVEIPVFRPQAGRVKANGGISEERMKKDLDDIKDAKFESKKTKKITKYETTGINLIHSRLSKIGIRVFSITGLPPTLLDATYDRDDISRKYGGDTQNTFPRIVEKLKYHGIDDFMFLNFLFNPNAPQKPGAPGLFNECEPNLDVAKKTWRLFVRVASRSWWLMGMYKAVESDALTKFEWRDQSVAYKDNWIMTIYTRTYGRNIRARITLRKRLRREPTPAEFLDAISVKEDKFDSVSCADIARAYDSGDERIVMWCLKCVGYPEDFQRENIEKFPIKDHVLWPGEEPKGPKQAKAKKREPKMADKKRRRSVEDEEQDGIEDYQRVYKPRGTRSRPIRV